RAGHRGAGVAVAMVANLVVTGGGYLGGHMVYRLGAPTGGPMATRHPAQEVVPRAPLRAA
ncbi:MAG: iron-sulfur protein, partial [Cellulomonas sp.]|nr:iron-sulfur protein [Cellulomonas sp.]